MNLLRIIRHLVIPDWHARRPFSAAVCGRIEQSIQASEATHRGEIRFAVEGGFDLLSLLQGITPRARAIKVFSDLGVWDTAENTGVLVYLQLVDHEFEIVADRGINARVRQDEWEAICQRMEAAFREGRFEEGMATRKAAGGEFCKFRAGNIGGGGCIGHGIFHGRFNGDR